MHNKRIVIRRTKRVHLIEDMDRACFPGEPIKGKDLNESVWFLATVDGKPAGYAGIRVVDGISGYLCRAGVLTEFQGHGLQKKLIKARERWARKQGLNSLITYTCLSAVRSPNSLIACGFKLYHPAKAWAGGSYQWLYFRKFLRPQE